MAAFRILCLIAAIPLPANFGRPLCAHCRSSAELAGYSEADLCHRDLGASEVMPI